MEIVIPIMVACGLAVGLVAAVVNLLAARNAAASAHGDAALARHHAAVAAQRVAAAEQRALVADQRAAAAEQRASFLAKYQAIVDAEAAASQMRAAAEHAARNVESAARDQAESLLASARQTQAAAVAEAARLDAESKAAVAKARADVDRLEAAVAALRNIAEGYGDRYILPTQGLLDELADQYAHTQPGELLKAVRKQTASLVKEGRAAESGYVEPQRRSDAIRFVVDAFNGKVDTILADAKDDNFGTLSQKIRDAFALVNQNGAAFRSTRITAEYLGSRLSELKWATVVHSLRERDREEQRALKERMREEERAQKEFEKAQREAEKEEEMLRRAMEKAKREAEQSGEADRARYEAKLAELSEKLRVAEEKGQRAMSMAQQTKVGKVYVISNIGSFGEHVYKIGMTRREDPRERIRELGDASVPFEFDVHALIDSDDAPALEAALHRCFVAHQMNKVNPRKEFFRVRLEEVRAELERMGVAASWTMTAACREYQESLAIERSRASTPGAPPRGVESPSVAAAASV